MNNTQRAKLDSYDRINEFNVNHAGDVASIPDYAAEQGKFETDVTAIKKSAAAQEQDTKGNKTASEMAKAVMANAVIKYSLRAAAKARITGNTALAKQLETPYSYIYRAPKTTALQRAKNTRDAINNNLTLFSAVTSGNITEIDNAITAYETIKDSPTQAKQTKKAAGTDPLHDYFKHADEALDNMYDLVLSYYSDTKPAMVNEMTLARQILNTGIRTTGVTFKTIAEENNEVILNASVTDISNGKVYTANDHGLIHIDKHRSGHFHFTVAAPDRIKVDFSADIKQGMNNEFNVKLQKTKI
ncbi:MAG: hypothetical protein HY958_11530 [Bacteroidia bacterium]|nr:hypothetical protein [Bacteroidia bacterium]